MKGESLNAKFSLDEEDLIDYLDNGVPNYLYLSAFWALKVRRSFLKGGSFDHEMPFWGRLER